MCNNDKKHKTLSLRILNKHMSYSLIYITLLNHNRSTHKLLGDKWNGDCFEFINQATYY